MKNPKINIFSENIHPSIEIDEKKAIKTAKALLEEYLKREEIFDRSCLHDNSGRHGFEEISCLSFDILFSDNEKTHQINKEYRGKDYAADIITFAIFADSEEKFIFDGEINLGEIIISLDKVSENALEKCTSFLEELNFLISHGIMHLLGFDHQTNEDYNFIVSAQTSALEVIK